MDFEKNGHGKSWKSHGILNGEGVRTMNKVLVSLVRFPPVM
jgi:hypothetical protein